MFLGPGVIVLPNVVIGGGAVVAVGSVVSASVTMVRRNPDRPTARVGKPPSAEVSFQEFSASLRTPETNVRFSFRPGRTM